MTDAPPEDADGHDDLSRLSGATQTMPPDGVFIDIAANRYRTCGVRVDGRIECWGNWNWAGGEPLDGEFEKISIAENSACAIRTDRSLVCWYHPGTGDAEQVVWEVPGAPFADVSAKAACGLREDGQLECWHVVDGLLAPPAGRYAEIAGWGTRGPICALSSEGWLVCWHDSAWFGGPLGDVYADLGSYFACGIGADDKLACWPHGPGDAPLEGVEPLVSAELWGHRACGVRAEGSLVCWEWDTEGWNTGGLWDPGWLGVSDVTWARVFGSGSEMPCLLSALGKLYCAGTSLSYDTPSELFERVAGPDRFVEVAVGGRHGCGIRTNGTVACWGAGDPNPPIDYMPMVPGP